MKTYRQPDKSWVAQCDGCEMWSKWEPGTRFECYNPKHDLFVREIEKENER